MCLSGSRKCSLSQTRAHGGNQSSKCDSNSKPVIGSPLKARDCLKTKNSPQRHREHRVHREILC